MLRILVLLLLVLFAHDANAADINAASCSRSDVQTAINTAVDGDRVLVPSGSCSWTVTVSPANKSIELIGAGLSSTIITCNTGTSHCLDWLTKGTGNTPAGFSRLSGFTFTQGASGSCQVSNGVSGTIGIRGVSHNIRIDHNRFEDRTCGTFHAYNDTRGVLDHNEVVNISCSGCHSLNFEHDAWDNSGENGDNSWFADHSRGTVDQWIVEDNTITNLLGANGWFATNDSGGARVTYRFNTWVNTTFQTHGTESNGRQVGQRHNEHYRQIFTWDGTINGGNQWPSIIAYRGGTNMTFDNKVTATNGGLGTISDFNTYRRGVQLNPVVYGYYPWGGCGIVNVVSITRSGSTATVTTSGNHLIHSSGSYITISGASQAEYNGTFTLTGTSSTTATYTVSGTPATPATGTITLRSVFDGNTDSTGYRCLDQAGAGKRSTAYSGYGPGNPPITPLQAAGNALEPIYHWNNKLNGTLTATAPNNVTDIYQANRDYYNENTAFNGTTQHGVGRGLRSARPATAAAGDGWWATDDTTNWNTSTTETYSALMGYSSGADGCLDIYNGTNWENCKYIPPTYPHTLVSGVSANPRKVGFSGTMRLQ